MPAKTFYYSQQTLDHLEAIRELLATDGVMPTDQQGRSNPAALLAYVIESERARLEAKAKRKKARTEN